MAFERREEKEAQMSSKSVVAMLGLTGGASVRPIAQLMAARFSVYGDALRRE